MYNKDFFKPKDVDDAKRIILTEEGCSTEWRWDVETRWSLQMLDTFWDLNEDSVVLDWGCGIGRMSKAMIDNFGCRVVGVDLQREMLEHAIKYVDNDKFSCLPYDNIFFNMPVDHFTHAIGIWVFQHSPFVQFELPLIYKALKGDGKLFVVENVSKAIPTNAENGKMHFFDDGVATKPILDLNFNLEAKGQIPLKFTTNQINKTSWWGFFNRNEEITDHYNLLK